MSSCAVTILCRVLFIFSLFFLLLPLTFVQGIGCTKPPHFKSKSLCEGFGAPIVLRPQSKATHVLFLSCLTQSTAPLMLNRTENANQNNCTECIMDAFMLVSCSLNANTTLLAEFLLQLCHHAIDSFTNHSFGCAGSQSLMHILNCAVASRASRGQSTSFNSGRRG